MRLAHYARFANDFSDIYADGDGYISREELHAFTALCLDARLIRPSLAKQLDWMRRKYLEHFGIVT